MSEFKTFRLKGLGEFFGGVTSISKQDYGHGTPFLTYKNVYANSKVDTASLELMNVTERDLRKRNCLYGDIFFTASSETPDEVAMSSVLLESVDKLTYNGFCKRFRLFDFNTLSPQYARYLFRGPSFRSEAYQYATGDIRFNISQESLGLIMVDLPPLPEQKAIAHILGKLDDKIELNRNMNETLEGMAQTLFKSWFVDFDPVLDNALAAGNKIPDALQSKVEKRTAVSDHKKLLHTNPELASQFPDRFTFNETLNKWIPEGWKQTDLTECLDTISKTYNLNEIPKIIFLNTGDIEDGRFLHREYSETSGLPGQAKKSIQQGDILYSEIRPKNKRFAYVYFDASEYVVSTKLMVLRSKNDIDPLFYYQILKSDFTINELQHLAESRSGTFPQIRYDTLKAIKFAHPNNDQILKNFSGLIRTNFKRSVENFKQIETLTNIRDTLLPKLISGKVRVPEKFIKEISNPEMVIKN